MKKKNKPLFDDTPFTFNPSWLEPFSDKEAEHLHYEFLVNFFYFKTPWKVLKKEYEQKIIDNPKKEGLIRGLTAFFEDIVREFEINEIVRQERHEKRRLAGQKGGLKKAENARKKEQENTTLYNDRPGNRPEYLPGKTRNFFPGTLK